MANKNTTTTETLFRLWRKRDKTDYLSMSLNHERVSTKSSAVLKHNAATTVKILCPW